MLNIKRKYSKGKCRGRLDDLSIITGHQPTRRGQEKNKNWMEVRRQNEKLKIEFLNARAQGLHMKNLVTNKSMSRDGDSTSAYFNNPTTANENQPTTSFFNRQYLSESPLGDQTSTFTETTISKVPQLVRTYLPRGRFQKNVLHPISQNAFPKKRTELEYWASFTGSGKKVHSSTSSTVYNMSTKSTTGYGKSSTSFLASYPMTRKDSVLVQQEVASLASNSSSRGSSATPPNYFPNNFGWQQQGYNGNFPGAPVRSLINSVQPPSVSNQSVDDSFTKVPQILDYGRVMQGKWVSREQLGDPMITKKYSIAQLMDILTGDSVPSDSDLTKTIFQPDQTMNSHTSRTSTTQIPSSSPAAPPAKTVSFMTGNNNRHVEEVLDDLFSQDPSGVDQYRPSSYQNLGEFLNPLPRLPPLSNKHAAPLNSAAIPSTSFYAPNLDCSVFNFNHLTATPNNAEASSTSAVYPPRDVNYEFGMEANISVDGHNGAQKTVSQYANDVLNFDDLITVNETQSTGNAHVFTSFFLNDTVVPSSFNTQLQEDDGYTTSEFF